jgi:hypothetical protein
MAWMARRRCAGVSRRPAHARLRAPHALRLSPGRDQRDERQAHESGEENHAACGAAQHEANDREPPSPASLACAVRADRPAAGALHPSWGEPARYYSRGFTLSYRWRWMSSYQYAVRSYGE